MRSMAVRPRIFSRLRDWAGRQLVVEDDGVGVDRRATGPAAPRPCPCRRRSPGRARPGAARPGPPRRRRRCRPAGPARRGGRSVSAAWPADGHADQHDLLPEAALDEAHGAARVSGLDLDQVPTRWLGPARAAPCRRRAARRRRRRRAGGRSPAGRPAPSECKATAAAQAPVPQARVSPTPRSHTRMVISSGPGPEGDELDVEPAGTLALELRAEPSTSTVAGSGPRTTRWGLPMSTRSWPWPTLQRSGVAVDLGQAHLDRWPSHRRAARSADTVDRPRPGGGQRPRTAGRGGTSPASSAAWARQRMPLPLISASLPSALRSSKQQGVGPRRHRRAGRPDQPVGADAPVAVAHGAGQPGVDRRGRRRGRAGRGSRCPGRGTWSSVRDVVMVRLQSPSRAGTTASGFSAAPIPGDPGVPPPPHPLAAGEGPGAPHRLGRAPPPGAPVLEVGEHLPVAEGLAGGAGQPAGPGRQPPHLVDQAGGHHGGEAVARSAGHRPAGAATPRPAATSSAGRSPMPGPKVENGRPLPKVTSRARTTRRRLVGSIRAAATGSSALRRRCRAAVSGSASSSARTSGYRPGGVRPSTTAWKYRPVPPTSRARWPRASMPASASAAAAW